MKKACEEVDSNKVQELLETSPALLEVSLDEVFFFFLIVFFHFLFFFVCLFLFLFLFLVLKLEDSLFLTFGIFFQFDYTPLLFSSLNGHVEIVKMLIAAQANTEARTNDVCRIL